MSKKKLGIVSLVGVVVLITGSVGCRIIKHRVHARHNSGVQQPILASFATQVLDSSSNGNVR